MREVPVSPFVISKRRNGHYFCNYSERGKEKQMRSLMMTNRIQVITRPATSGFNFPCFKQPQNVIANIGKEGHDQDWDRNRYRRK